MELILMILVPFPIGYFVRNRLAAYVTYLAVHSFAFTIQTTFLLVEWASGESDRAFGATYPEYRTSEVWAYAVVNLVIFLVALGLVFLGHRVGTGRRLRAGQVSLDPVA